MAGVVSRSEMRRKQDELWMAWRTVESVQRMNRRLKVALLALASVNVAWVLGMLVERWG